MGLRSIMELHELILNLRSPENGFQIRARGIKSRVNISSLDAPNAPNRCAPTVNVVKEDFYVLIALPFIFYRKKGNAQRTILLNDLFFRFFGASLTFHNSM